MRERRSSDLLSPPGYQSRPVCMRNVVDLSVPFSEKDEAKQLGARWNPERRIWYVPAGVEPLGIVASERAVLLRTSVPS